MQVQPRVQGCNSHLCFLFYEVKALSSVRSNSLSQFRLGGTYLLSQPTRARGKENCKFEAPSRNDKRTTAVLSSLWFYVNIYKLKRSQPDTRRGEAGYRTCMADEDKQVISFLAAFLFCAPHSYPCDPLMQINAWSLGSQAQVMCKGHLLSLCSGTAQKPGLRQV